MNGKIGVIGGSGLYQMDGLQGVNETKVDTPFGEPSDFIITGTLGGKGMVFLPRHGVGHRIQPSDLNYRANIFAMKKLGVEWIISLSAVGSMKEEIAPGDIVIPDQYYDNTRRRISTFFGDGVVAHVSFADPTCVKLNSVLSQAARTVGCSVHEGGTYLCIEGPQFSTRAESNIYRQWGVDVIGMTNVTEAKLAREAEICYSTVALPTDYDVWRESKETVTVEQILEVLNANVEKSKSIIREAVNSLPFERDCECADALKDAILTAPEKVSQEKRMEMEVLLGKYLR
jgi:5'-methylthioadenosine phosphorylase